MPFPEYLKQTQTFLHVAITIDKNENGIIKFGAIIYPELQPMVHVGNLSKRSSLF